MLILLSPAKRLNSKPLQSNRTTEAFFQKEMKILLKELKGKTSRDLITLMKVSSKIADLNVERYKQMEIPFEKDYTSTAIHTFQGDAYIGLAADKMTDSDLEFSQYHLRILSGFYGLLRPLDKIMPYRLEMGIKLKNRKFNNLYEFWGEKITDRINHELALIESNLIINLASKEYFKSVKTEKLNARTVTINFKEFRDGKYIFMSAYGKKARGLMSKYIIMNKLTTAEELKGFSVEGYEYTPSESSKNEWLFSRSS